MKISSGYNVNTSIVNTYSEKKNSEKIKEVEPEVIQNKSEKKSAVGNIDIRNCTREELIAFERELYLSGKIGSVDSTVVSILSLDFTKAFGVSLFKTPADSEGRRDWIKEFNLKIDDQRAMGGTPQRIKEYKDALSKIISFSKNSGEKNDIVNDLEGKEEHITKVDMKAALLNLTRNQFMATKKENMEDSLFDIPKNTYKKSKYVQSEDINRRLHILSFLKQTNIKA